jgi:hypothetical protein
MPLCPQITNTPITVTQTADFTVSSVTPITPATSVDTASLSTQITTAQATADGKNKVNYSTSAPSGSGTNVGDIWWQYSAGIVIGQYSWNGSSWVTSPISSTVIANLDAGKITSGIISSIEYNNGSGTFRVTAAGALTASSATITGAINATSGYIGSLANGWNFSGSGFLTNSGGTTILYPTTSPGGNASTYSIFTDRGVYAERIYSTGTQATSIFSLGGLSVNGQVSGAAGSFVVNSSGNMTTVGSIAASGAITTSSTATITGVFTAVDAGVNTNTNTANAWLSTGGVLRRTTASSIRYKENVTDITNVPELDPKKLLALPVRAFTYKEDYLSSADDRYQQLFPGFISEEVDAIYPMAADYENGEIESWNDRMIVPALLSLVQELYKRVEELEAK